MDYSERHPDRKYLSSFDVLGKDEFNALITGFRMELIERDPSKKEKPVIELYGLKPMVLNITNDKQLTRLTRSSASDGWIGTIITIGVDTVRAFGEETFGLRIRRKLGSPEAFLRESESIEELRARYAALGNASYLNLTKAIAAEKWTNQ